VLLRNGREVRAEVEVSNTFTGSGPQASAVEGSALAGATFQALSDADAQRRGIRGVLVSEVVRGSRAAGNGVRKGDLIIAVNRTRVRDLEDLEYALQRSSESLGINVIRGRDNLFITAR
ncbi:MAG: PDZ domain-containing protein, partial [Gammaproteobacteria bacterium]